MPPRCQLLPGSLPLRTRALPLPQAVQRTFTTSAPLCGRKGGDLGMHLPKHIMPKNAAIPEYPYGPSELFKQSNKGLYGGQRIQFGNNVSPDTETKTRRHWKPNIVTKGLYSVILKKRIRVRLTARVLKTMDREGGFDNYLLKEGESRIKELGPMGWALRWRLMQSSVVKARFRAEAAALGLAQEVIDQQWPQPEKPKKLSQTERLRLRRKQRRKQRAAEEEMAAEAAEEEQAQMPEEFVTATELNYTPEEKYHRLHFYRKQIRNKSLAPNKKVVEKMALRNVAIERQEYRIFGDKYTLMAFQKEAQQQALRAAEKETEKRKQEAKEAKEANTKVWSGTEKAEWLASYKAEWSARHKAEWLARYKAKRLFKQREAQRAAAGEIEPANQAPTPKPAVLVDEEKDWADLAQTNKA